MMVPAVSRLAVRTGFLVAALGIVSVPVRAANAGPDAVVVLPPFEVKDMRPWLFAEIPGMQILSLASERETSSFAQRLQETRWLTPLLLPPGLDRTLTAPSSLFLRHFAGDALAARVSAGLGFSAFSFSIFKQDTSISFPTEVASRDWSAGREYLNLDFMRVSGLALPRVPLWYRDGMGELLRAATGTARAVFFPARSWVQARLNPAFDSATGVPGPEPMPVVDLLGLRAPPGAMTYDQRTAEDRQRYLRGASLFSHWGFFGNNGEHRAAFLALVGEASNRAADEAMVKRRLGLTLKELQRQLDGYAVGVSAATLYAPKDLPPLAPAVARPATRGEVARIVGEAYLLLANNVPGGARQAYLANAREVLDDARDAGEADAAVFQQLGALAHATGADDEARSWLERAVAGEIQRPSAYVALAELRLNRQAAENPNQRLTAAETAAVWGLLQKADAMKPRLPSTFALAVGMWRNSATRPGSEDLALLADGIDAFPDETTLRRDALRLFNQLEANSDPALAARMAVWRSRLGYPSFAP